jgi:uncharacterized protein (DUF2147 family)
MKNLFLTTLMLVFSAGLFAQKATCVGRWTTIDDKTGKKKSIVELYKNDGKLYGKIVYLYPREGRPDNPVCEKCTDDRKDKPLVGLQLVRSLEWDGEVWYGGTIVDPENGKVYKTKLWIDEGTPDKLNVRGYLGPFFRTQTWTREKEH